MDPTAIHDTTVGITQFLVQLPFVGVTIWLTRWFVGLMGDEREKSETRRAEREQRDMERDSIFAEALKGNTAALTQLTTAINQNVVTLARTRAP